MPEVRPPIFVMDRLLSYDDSSLLDELRRVASLIPNQTITAAAYDALGRASSSTLRRRFGSWQAALEAAGLSARYCGKQSLLLTGV